MSKLKSPRLWSKTVILFFVAFFVVEAASILYIDRPLATFTHTLDQTHPALIDFFRSITDAGKSVWYLVPCGIVIVFGAFLSRAKDASILVQRMAGYLGVRCCFVFLTVAASGLTADLLKFIIGRARPFEFFQNGTYAFVPFTSGYAWNGMPSGHATTVFALAFSLSILYPRLRLLWLTLALLLAASRVMVDAHYLSDICAGAVLGWSSVVLIHRHGINHISKVIFPIDRLNTPS